MKILLDTNVLLRMSMPLQPDHLVATSAVERIRKNGNDPVIVPQVAYEYWVVATRPSTANGMGLSASDARQAIDEISKSFGIMRDERGIFAYWLSLVSDNAVVGKRAHDMRLVAAMIRHGIPQLVTFNKADFVGIAGISVFAPTDVP